MPASDYALPRQPKPEAIAGFPHIVQAAEVAGTPRPGQTGHYRNILYGPELIDTKTDPRFPQTSYESFEQGLARAPSDPCLGHRAWDPVAGDYKKEYTWQTYTTIADRRTNIGSGLVHLASTGVLGANLPTTQWSIGLWTVNRPEWQIASQAAIAYNLIGVSLYETLGPDVVEYCINHAEVRAVFSSPNHIPQLLDLARSGKCPTLKLVVSVDNWADIDTKYGGPVVGALTKGQAFQEWGKQAGVRVMDMLELEALGKNHLQTHRPPKPTDIATICYTSGTTGMPKGAVITHKLLATTTVANLHGKDAYEGGDVLMSFLPLSHIFERFIEDLIFCVGAAVGYSTGDNLRLIEDIQTLKPTVMCAVPRVLNRLYQVIKAGTIDAPGLKGALSRRAFAAKLENLQATGAVTHAFWDRLVMNKIKMAMGGRMRAIGTGSAPLAPSVLQFISVAFCLPIQEGYGQTEGGGTATRNTAGDWTSAGLVGPPQVCNEIKLVDVPEMGYLSTDKPEPRGEMYLRGDNLITEYYKDPKKTAEAMADDGWFKTGDVASVDQYGRFRIIDRVKNLIKLSQGEYVAVEKVENVYSVPSLGAQILVYADSLQSHLILFVVPDPVALAAFASKVTGKQISPTDQTALAQAAEDPKVCAAALKEFDKEAAAQKLNSFERAKQLAFRLTPFSVEEDTLTPTMKMKRNVAYKLLKPKADKLYAEFDAQNKTTRAKL